MKKNIKQIIFITFFIFALFVLILLCNIVYTSFLNKIVLENYANSIINKSDNSFTIDKIVLFSSCSSDSDINSNNTTTINNLSQFTDIAIFINNSTEEFSLKNTLKSVSIKDLSFNTIPSLGTPQLYYKSLTDFATDSVDESNIISSDLNFSISAENTIDYSKPILFNNCANPITLSYVNSNIASNYTITNTDNSITYDGSLLKKCNILLNDIRSSFSFTIYIENNLGENFKCPIYIDIPLESATSSIYNGSHYYIYNPNYSFYSY